MAQMQPDRPPADDERVNSLGRLTYAIGSVVSVGLVIGMGVWGYKLLVRDVSGVPVIRAAEGPMRVQPEDPGGDQASHQGLAVNAVAAAGSAEPSADTLILAPAPLDLDFIEVAPADAAAGAAADPEETATDMAEAEPEATEEALPEEAETAEAEVADSEEAAEDAAPQSDEDAKMLALAEALSDGVTPIGASDEATEEERLDAEDVATADETEAQTPVEGGIGRSLRPRQRPAALASVQTVSAPLPGGASGTTREVDPGTIPTGTRLAQLGAYSSEEIAREEWTRLNGRFEEYLAGKDRVIERAESGGRTFYRLRAMGFDDLADARRFCSALVAERAECIPVVTR